MEEDGTGENLQDSMQERSAECCGSPKQSPKTKQKKKTKSSEALGSESPRKRKESIFTKLGHKLLQSHRKTSSGEDLEDNLSRSMESLHKLSTEGGNDVQNGARSASEASIFLGKKSSNQNLSAFEVENSEDGEGRGRSSNQRSPMLGMTAGVKRVSSETSIKTQDVSASGWKNMEEVIPVLSQDSEFFLFDMNESVQQDSNIRQRRHELMQHSFFHLEVWLKEGKDLVVRDSSGTSDPYVKFKIGSKHYYKSRTVFKNLNPKWDEKFTIPIEDVFKPVCVKCYDYDRGVSDDRMGSAELDLSTLELNTPTELKLELKEKKDEGYMGYILLQCTLIPKSSEEKEQFHQFKGSTLRKSPGTLESQARKLKMQIWSGIVNIVLVEGHNLMAMDDNGLSDPYVKFRLGQEKYKSKHKLKTLNPRWLEQFSLRIFDDQSKTLEISVYDHDLRSDDFMGRATIDLSEIEKEKTHTIVKELEDGAGTIKLLLTISGTQGAETITDLVNYTTNTKERDDLYRSYGIFNSSKNLKDIGWLQVKVIKAQGLMAADIGGKSDPFCVLELVNARLQTQTEYKTLNPEWNKVFTFNVKDIHSVLEVTVYDEDRDKKAEFLGKIAVPILQMKRGIRRWYALKDKKLLGRSKGAILLEMDFIYNPVKAAVRTVNPREEKYMQPEPKFKIALMKRNINRVSQIISSIMEVGRFLQSCFEWESKARSITAFTVFLIITWFFEPYMLPVTLLILFLKNYLIKSAKEAFSVENKEEVVNVDEEDDDDEDEASKDEKKSVREKLQAAQEVCLQVQQGMDMVASLGERIKK
ncbi:multiple C2 and transmembrane domain-containing protein 1-like isoform X7 [Saccostrea cucullata]|uniref:multiple C2 and transmembrane domain-containing protein 1-like isoform X7 n=1 Tax=Saccostrea cuccullata TaxID=36930 RepID=UPI002ED4EA05